MTMPASSITRLNLTMTPRTKRIIEKLHVTEKGSWSSSTRLDVVLRSYSPVGRRGYTGGLRVAQWTDRKSTRLNSSHVSISYAVFCFKKENNVKIMMRSTG